MTAVFGCFGPHDVRLVGLAAVVCTLAAFTSLALLRHAGKARGGWRTAWLGVAALAGGSGIWATHFVAMLAFEPGMPTAYDVNLTVLSLLNAIFITGLGFGLVLSVPGRIAAALGGAILGAGIATMHYTGMGAFRVAGTLSWSPMLVVVSIVIGVVLAGAALTASLGQPRLPRRLLAGGLLLLAICGHHFTGMGAVTITLDPAVTIPGSAIPTEWLAVGVALASIAVLLLSIAALGLDIHERRRTQLARERLTSLANAAVEGLVVCRGGAIVSANDSFADLVGRGADALVGTELTSHLPGDATRLALAGASETPLEAELRRRDGTSLPVELIFRPIVYGALPHYAVAVRDLRPRRRAERQIHFLAHHDALTGLANRASFAKRLDQELRNADATGRKCAVLCLDLDRFKEVNDLFGHAAGDAMLENVARIVSEVLNETQMMARLGGDEFAIVKPCDHPVAAGRLAERVLEALRAGVPDGAGPAIATSIGVAVYPDDAADRQTLLSNADTALYRAKAEGRNTYRFFEASMGAEVRERRTLEHDLRHAVARGEMHIAYQPQTDVKTGAVTGFEALLRWRHPVRGAISPAVFIPIAEESGVILQLGEWVLREACREAARWELPLSIAVNVSAVQVHWPHLVTLVNGVLSETGLAAERLEIEITETALIRDPGRTLLTLRQLKALGLRVAMDDFGTGYSSLSNLRDFPFDKIKIDASFVRSIDVNPQSAAILRSVLGLGRGLGLPVLAEGVETADEMRFLTDERCDGAQGYLIGRPGPISGFAHHVKRQAVRDAA